MGSNKNKTRHISLESNPFGLPLWLVGWLFTLGFAGLNFWYAIWALALWPYYLGKTLALG